MVTRDLKKAVHSERVFNIKEGGAPERSVAEFLLMMDKHIKVALKNFSTEEPVEICNTVKSQVRKVAQLADDFAMSFGTCLRDGLEESDGYIFGLGDLVKVKSERLISSCVLSNETLAVFSPFKTKKDKLVRTDYWIISNNNPEIFEQLERVSLIDLQEYLKSKINDYGTKEAAQEDVGEDSEILSGQPESE